MTRQLVFSGSIYRTNLHRGLKAELQTEYNATVCQLSTRLQDILELLCDGNCHSLYELQVGAQLSESQTRTTVEFLTEYGFAEMTDNDQKVRISEIARKLLEKTTI